MRNTLFILFVLVSLSGFSQEMKTDTIINDMLIIRNDSMTMALDEIVLFKNRNFKSNSEKKYYYWYYKKVHKAYPFAKLASERLTEINKDLEKITSNRKRKKHIKEIQKFMEGEFTDSLKTLTRTEGRILIKLVDRQTGETMYDLIKEYRSGWNAFWYNSTASLFKLSLKSEYHPESDPLDFIVEDILQRSFANGTLKRQESKLSVEYFELLEHWKGINMKKEIDAYIEKYK